MKVYLVGGAVRDKLLGLEVTEKDYVVVGATKADMLEQGFKLVGKDFPVFLHPKTNEEYALARIERKVGKGYHGFEFIANKDVTLEEDLKRRDLTINAIAMDDKGNIIDPYNGQKDLTRKLLQHVSQAFLEDPLRVLRVARFYARFSHLGFIVAPDTILLMQTIIKSGELATLTPERIFLELDKAISYNSPWQFFILLYRLKAQKELFHEFVLSKEDLQVPKMLYLKAAVNENITNKQIRLTLGIIDLLPKDFIKDKEQAKPMAAIAAKFCLRLKMPNAIREFLVLLIQNFHHFLTSLVLTPQSILNLFEKTDPLRRYDRFKLFIQAAMLIAKANNITLQEDLEKHYSDALEKIKSINMTDIVNDKLKGKELAKTIREARLQALL